MIETDLRLRDGQSYIRSDLPSTNPSNMNSLSIG
jgi:hypothetical protein